MPRLSIIIPHVDSEQELESTLLSVLENRDDETEVLLAHSGDYRDPYGLGDDEIRLLDVGQGASVVELLNNAVANAQGEVIHSLLPGCVVTPDWTREITSLFRKPSIAAISPRLVVNESKSMENRHRTYYGLDPNWIPRRHWLEMAKSGDAAIATLCGGFYRKSVLRAMSGWLGTGESSVSRETAEAEFAMITQCLGFEMIYQSQITVLAPRRVIEGKVGGYALGHDAARLQSAFREMPDIDAQPETLATKLSHLASGLIHPKGVAERLGWVLGSTDRTLVADLRWRLERARMDLDCSRDDNASSFRRAA